MFSPEASIASARNSLRNPRRRPRNSEGPQQTQPRRKRSKLGDETFVPVGDDSPSSHGNGSIALNGHAVESNGESSLMLMDMPIRDKKGSSNRVLKENIAQYLNKNENYSVKKLPSFPSNLTNGSIPYRASALPAAGLALAVTADHALVWDYISPSGASKVLTLPLPPTLKNSDPLPLGEIVRNGPTNDFGVVVAAPATGKIVFWENIDSAEARSHFPQRKQGIEGSFRLYSGERITRLVDADHAGYILVTSSGRLAQLTLRDPQGRACITATVLNSPNGPGGSFFSFKGLLGGAIRKTIASVQTRPSGSKGQMEVIAATRNGLFQLWDLSWSGQQIFKCEIDARENMLATVQIGTPAEKRGQLDIQVLDFALVGQPQEDNTTGLLVLVALLGLNDLEHFLLEVDLTEHDARVSRAIPLRQYHSGETRREATGTLLLPEPGHTALVQFPDAIVVASLAQPEDSPENQIFSDSGKSLMPFQDSVYFKTDAHVQVVGHALEQTGKKSNVCGALLFIQDYGILQVNANPPPKTESEERTKVTPYSKLMQVTFFSTVPGTILDFSTKYRYSFKLQAVQDAAIEISTRVLSSSFEQLEGNAIVLEDQLRKRAFLLQTLNAHLRSDYESISWAGKWQLLWHAEKLAASLQLWRWYQNKLREQEKHPELYPEKNIMSDIILALHEKYKTLIDPTRGETDPIRQFFLKDINSLEILLPWSWNYFRVFYIGPDSNKSLQSIMQRLSEADEVLLITLETGFSFRQENAERYGIETSSLKDGVLQPGYGYDLLPQFWTSTHNITSSVRSVVDAGRKYADDCYEKHDEEDVATKVASDNPRLVRMSCQTHIERFQWALEQNDEKKRQMGKTLREEWNENIRPKQIYHLAGIGLATEGMNLAEQYNDMQTLAELIWEETSYLEENLPETHSKMEQAEISVKLKRIQERVNRYFDQYGDEWAEAYFTKHVAMSKSGTMLSHSHQYQKALTKYLRADPSRSRLNWINEIRGEKNYEGAAHALYITATRQETKAWSNKVELSMSKLALLAYEEGAEASPESRLQDERKVKRAKEGRESVTKDIDGRLEMATIQDMLYTRAVPVITPALDDESAVQLLLSEYGTGRLDDRPALQTLVKQGFDELIHHRVIDACLLVDVLTLVNLDTIEDHSSVNAWNQYALALKVVALYWGNFHRNVRQGMVGLIWKRLLLRDDWQQVDANSKGMSEQARLELIGHTALGWTLKILCEWLHDDEKVFGRVMPQRVEHMYGAGCTDGELCTRFASEDLRQPIIRENLLDEAMIKGLVEKHRLEEWLESACKAGSMLYRAERRREQSADDDSAVEDVKSDAQPIADVEPTNGGKLDEGEAPSSVDQDVEMQGL